MKTSRNTGNGTDKSTALHIMNIVMVGAFDEYAQSMVCSLRTRVYEGRMRENGLSARYRDASLLQLDMPLVLTSGDVMHGSVRPSGSWHTAAISKSQNVISFILFGVWPLWPVIDLCDYIKPCRCQLTADRHIYLPYESRERAWFHLPPLQSSYKGRHQGPLARGTGVFIFSY